MSAKNPGEEELPSKNSELNADFLIQFVKIDKRDAEEVAKILSDKKVRVVATLLTWETNDVLFNDLFGDLPSANTFKAIARIPPGACQPIGQPVAKLATLEKIDNTDETVKQKQ